MRPNQERNWPLVVVLLAAVAILQGWLLLPELRLHPTPLNDDAFHIAASLAARDALRENPTRALDIWHPYWSLGYPVWHAYQPLPHLATGALGLLTPESAFDALFALVRTLLLLAFPISVFLGSRWIGLSAAAAAAAAILSPLISTDGLYGLEYGSYLWRGSGLYTQLWAMNLLPLAIGRSLLALRGRAGAFGAGLLIALTFLSHSIYGYVAVVSLVVGAIVFRHETGGVAALRRSFSAIAVGGLLVAFFLAPILLDHGTINHSRWEAAWKWDSFGHERVIEQLATGNLFDHGRLPVLTLIVIAGVVVALRAGANRAERFVCAGFLTWICLYFGRPTWGILLGLAGIPSDLHLHRLVGAVHLFGLLAAGSAIGAVVGWAWSRGSAIARIAVIAGAVILLVPALIERHGFVRQGDSWAAESETAIRTEQADLDALAARLRALQSANPGRVYPGLAGGWGREFRTGSVPVYAWLSLWRMDAVAFLFHSLSLTSDVMVLFDETRPAEYDAFDVRYVVMDAGRAPPPFLAPLEQFGRFRIYEGPATGRIGIGKVAFEFRGDRKEVYEVSSAWLKSALPGERRYGRIVLDGGAAPAVPLVRRGDLFPPPDPQSPAPEGDVVSIGRDGNDWSAEIDLDAPGIVVLRETYHPGWRAEIDGAPARPFMVTPGFVAAGVPAGRHAVSFRYRPGLLKIVLLFTCTVGVVLAGIAASLRRPRPAGDRPVEVPSSAGFRSRPLLRIVRILLALVVLVSALPLLQGKLVAGHDALEYPPRVVEFHENVAHGWLAPIWAPDLGNGHGQPLFLFSPPLFYWIVEPFYAAGSGVAPSISLAALLLYLVAGAGAWLAGREAWGRGGGLLAAAAWIAGSYLLLDLYVRGNFAEFAAVALYPWAALGLLKLHRGGGATGFMTIAIAVALVFLAHIGAAVVFLLWIIIVSLAWAVAGRTWRSFASSLAGALVGLGLASYFLVPCIAQMPDTKVHLLREGFLSYGLHFVEPWQLIASKWGYGLSVPGPGDGMSFAVGIPHLLIALIAAVLWWWGRPRLQPDGVSLRSSSGREAAGPAILVGVAAVFALLTTPFAALLWRWAPPLQYLAYPWRLLSAASLSLAIAAGALPASSVLRRARLSRIVTAAALLALLVWAYPRARPKEFLTFDDAYYEPSRIASQGMNTTTREEYEPRWVAARPPYSESEVEVVGGLAFVLAREGDPWHRTFRIEAQQASMLRLNLFYFPGWEATLDGAVVQPGISEADGRIVIGVPEGRHTLAVRLADTDPRTAGKILSAVTALFLVVFVVRSRRRRSSGAGRGGGAAVSVAAVFGAAIAAAHAGPGPEAQTPPAVTSPARVGRSAREKMLESPLAVEVSSPSGACSWRGREGDDPLLILVRIDPSAIEDPSFLDTAVSCAAERGLAIVARLVPPADWQRASDPYAALDPWIAALDRLVARHRGRVRAFEVGDRPEDLFEPNAWAYLIQKAGTAIRSVDPDAPLIAGPLGAGSGSWLDQIPPTRLTPYVDAIAIADPVDLAVWIARRARDYPALPVWLHAGEQNDPIATVRRIYEARAAGAATVVALQSAARASEVNLLQNLILAVPGRFVVDRDPLVIAMHGEAGQGSPAGEPIATLLDPLGQERAAIIVAPVVGPLQPLRVSVGPDRVRSVRAHDLATGRDLAVEADKPPAGGAAATFLKVTPATGPVVLRYIVDRGPRREPEVVGVTAEYTLTAEEIIARERAFEATEARFLDHYAAKATLSYHYRAEALNETVDFASVNRFFWRDGVGEYEETDLYVNGARWRGPAPSLPFVQAEKVKEVPLEIRLDETYLYRLEGRDTVAGRPCYVIAFDPVDPNRPSFSGRVWIDAETFARHRIRVVQRALKEPITSNADEIEYGAVAGDGREHWLPLRGYRQMVFTVLGRTIVVERRVAWEEFAINTPSFEEIRDQAYASGRPILREDETGAERITIGRDGERVVVKESLKNVAIFGGISFGLFDLGNPFAAINYFDFNFRGTGTQFDVAFAGPFIDLVWTDPGVGKSRWELTLEGRFAGIREGFKRTADIGRIEEEDLEVLVEDAFVVLGRPLTSFSRAEFEVGLNWQDFARTTSTSGAMVLPPGALTGTATARFRYQRSGTLLALYFSSGARSRWDDWGIPGGGGGSAGDTRFQRWGMEILKNFYLSSLSKLSFSGAAGAGASLDRFTRFRIGEFRNIRVRGYNGADITFDRGVTASATSLFTLPRGNLSFSLSIDGAVIENEEDFGLAPTQSPASTYRTRAHVEPHGDREWLAGLGAGLTWNGPWGTLMSLRAAWGLGTSMDVGGSSAAFRFVMVRTFDRWPWGKPKQNPAPAPSVG